MTSLESLALIGAEPFTVYHAGPKHDRNDILPRAAVPIIAACITGTTLTIQSVANEVGMHRAALGTMLGNGKYGARLWVVMHSRPRELQLCRQNALRMTQYLTPDGRVELEKRLGMPGEEISAAIMALPEAILP